MIATKALQTLFFLLAVFVMLGVSVDAAPATKGTFATIDSQKHSSRTFLSRLCTVLFVLSHVVKPSQTTTKKNSPN
ncbi:MAG: hypothetical protein JOS17DRAFT_759192 [Linnemannia elongata]|nr:MAG: hypothetical protein JOS17DRAFT_759192 [Linnemannia elongata]